MDNVDSVVLDNPSPADFVRFLPWACSRLGVEVTVIVSRVEINTNSTRTPSVRKEQKSTTREKTASFDASPEKIKIKTSFPSSLDIIDDEACLFIDTVYDTNNQLIQIKFMKNKFVPKIILKIISLTLPYNNNLAAIYIDRGLDYGGLYELSKIVAESNITEVVLDNTVIEEANYYLLLQNNSSVTYLSLARCKLDDNAVQLIASNLINLQATPCLSALNLPSNRITDEGAKCLGDVLRVNRQLSYLNLADNMITDIGADSIFKSLTKFALTADEILEMKKRRANTWRQKYELKKKMADKRDMDKQIIKKKAIKVNPSPAGKKCKSATDIAIENMFDNMESTTETLLKPIKEPFECDNTITENGIIYCLGNNALFYLSLAYNNLTYFSLRTLYNVVCAQNSLKRKLTGLINVCIEGNNIPQYCEELRDIDKILKANLIGDRGAANSKKKVGSKTNTK